MWFWRIKLLVSKHLILQGKFIFDHQTTTYSTGSGISNSTGSGISMYAIDTDAVINLIGNNTFVDMPISCGTAVDSKSGLSCIVKGSSSTLNMYSTVTPRLLSFLSANASNENATLEPFSVVIELGTLNLEFAQDFDANATSAATGLEIHVPSTATLQIGQFVATCPALFSVKAKTIVYNGDVIRIVNKDTYTPVRGSLPFPIGLSFESINNALKPINSNVILTSGIDIQVPLVLGGVSVNVVGQFKIYNVSYQVDSPNGSQTPCLSFVGNAKITAHRLYVQYFENAAFAALVEGSVVRLFIRDSFITGTPGRSGPPEPVFYVKGSTVTINTRWTAIYDGGANGDWMRAEHGKLDWHSSQDFEVRNVQTFHYKQGAQVSIYAYQTSFFGCKGTAIKMTKDSSNDVGPSVSISGSSATFNGNTGDHGGVVYSTAGVLTIQTFYSLFINNEASLGGALHIGEGGMVQVPQIRDGYPAVFQGNRARYGAIYIDTSSSHAIQDMFNAAVFRDNVAVKAGCMIYLFNIATCPSSHVFLFSGNNSVATTGPLTACGMDATCYGVGTECTLPPPTPHSACGPDQRWTIPHTDVQESLTLSSPVRITGGSFNLFNLQLKNIDDVDLHTPWIVALDGTVNVMKTHLVLEDPAPIMNITLVGWAIGSMEPQYPEPLVGTVSITAPNGCKLLNDTAGYPEYVSFMYTRVLTLDTTQLVKCDTPEPSSSRSFVPWIVAVSILSSFLLASFIGLTVVLVIFFRNKKRYSSSIESASLLDHNHH